MNAENHGIAAIMFKYDSVTQSSFKGDLSLTRLLGSTSHSAGEEHAEALSRDRRKKSIEIHSKETNTTKTDFNIWQVKDNQIITCSTSYRFYYSMQKIRYTFTCI